MLPWLRPETETVQRVPSLHSIAPPGLQQITQVNFFFQIRTCWIAVVDVRYFGFKRRIKFGISPVYWFNKQCLLNIYKLNLLNLLNKTYDFDFITTIDAFDRSINQKIIFFFCNFLLSVIHFIILQKIKPVFLITKTDSMNLKS